MLEEILKTCTYVTKNSKHVSINYEKIDDLIIQLKNYKSKRHYLMNMPYDIYKMDTDNLINLLLIYDSINFSFWGDPKWTITSENNSLDGSIALFDLVFRLFEKKDSKTVFEYLNNMTLEEFKLFLKGNIDIPLVEERYNIIKEVTNTVIQKMDGNFYNKIKNINNDIELFNFIITSFNSFADERTYENKTIYFYKRAQLLTSDILHMLEEKENIKVNYTNLLGCADYKIPQVLNSLDILIYDEELSGILENRIEIKENSVYEVEIRSATIVVINDIYNNINKVISRIDINDFVWLKSQDKAKINKFYHLTRTTSY